MARIAYEVQRPAFNVCLVRGDDRGVNREIDVDQRKEALVVATTGAQHKRAHLILRYGSRCP
jgi:hypothetical protein